VTRRIKPLLLLLLAAATVIGVGSGASAHSGKQTYLYVNLFDDGVDGRVEFPAADLGAVLGFDFGASAGQAAAVADANADEIRAYVADHFAIGDDDGDWDLEFGAVEILPVAGNYVVVPFIVQRDFDAAPRSFVMEFDGIIHANDQKDALLHIENDWRSAQFANEDDPIVGFSVGQTVQTIIISDAPTIESISAARGLGTDAVRTGIDQLLFVVALVLPVGLVARGRSVSDPAPTMPAVARRLARLLGISIVAHSSTLWLVGLGVIELSARTTSILVALALLALAVYAVLRFGGRREDVVVGVLSLVQGLGLGLAFTATQLDRYDTLLPLVSFNLGVEVAVLVIAALTLAVTLPVRRTALAPIALYGIAVVIAGYSIGWLIERVGDTSISMEQVANPLRVWPRNLWVVILIAILGGAVYWWTASRGRLRPLDAPSPDDDASPVPRTGELVNQ
jgi:hypothetical protein